MSRVLNPPSFYNKTMLVHYLTSNLTITLAYSKVQPKCSRQMSPLFTVGPHGPSHGKVITNAFCKNDLMVASYPCNEGGILDMCVTRETSHEVGQALRSEYHCAYDRFVM